MNHRFHEAQQNLKNNITLAYNLDRCFPKNAVNHMSHDFFILCTEGLFKFYVEFERSARPDVSMEDQFIPQGA